MNHFFRKIALAAVAGLWAATAHAATVGFNVVSATATIQSSVPISGDAPAPLFVNATASGLVGALGSKSYDNSVVSFERITAFEWTGRRNDGNPASDNTADSYAVTASIILGIGSSTFEFIANGVLSNWTVGGTGNITGTPTLVWNPVIGLPNPNFNVVFGNVFSQGETNRSLTTTVDVSVVPLPAGALLLGTALLGLLGLSRRRKPALA